MVLSKIAQTLQVLALGVTLVTAVTVSAASHSETLPKAFAVFVVSYNTGNDDAVGGVAGTAFFVAKDKAITAHHVLQAQSFRPAPGFEKVRVWLVHEDQMPIELKLENVTSLPNQDMATIRLPSGKSVAKKFVFDVQTATFASGVVSTEGFRANSTGPLLAREGADVTIIGVPHLERLNSQGQLVRKAVVDLQATDVKLKSIPCLEMTYTPVRGLSGGPVLMNGKVVGMNSFADPSGAPRTWAVEIRR